MRRNRFKEAGVTKELVADLYIRQNKTDAEMAGLFGVSDVAMSWFRRKHGIPTKKQVTRLTFEHPGPKFEDLTPIELAAIYTAMGDGAIAARYGVSKPTVAAKRAAFKIEALSKSARSTSVEELTEEQRDVILGSLLGDGHVLERGVFKVSHYQEQFLYLAHLHQVLATHALPISYEEKEMENGRLTFAFYFRTVQHEWLRTVRETFYPQGEKIFPETVLRTLSARALAYWYFDDGHLDSGLPSFALGKITSEQQQQVLKMVADRFNLATYTKPEGSATGKLMGIRAISADAFFALIREFATPDMLYKFPPKHWPRGAVARQPVRTEDAVMLPKSLCDEAKEWSTLDESDRSSLIEAFASYWESTGFPYHTPRPEELTTLSRIEASQVIQGGVIKARQVGQGVCQGVGRHIWEGRSHGSPSPVQLFSDPIQLRAVISFCFQAGQIPNAARLRSALRYWRRNGVYNFRPSAAKALVDNYCRVGGVVFDPCAGYGGRMLGTLLSKARPRYIGCEPSSASLEGLLRLRQWVASYLPEFLDKADIHQTPAEEFDFPQGVDMVMTSPPYWKREVYSDEPTQSSSRYTTYASWLTQFWGPVIRKSVEALRTGGWLVLNVDDFTLGGSFYPLVADTIRLVAGHGLGQPEHFKYELPGAGSDGGPRFESVLCWPKGQHLGVAKSPAESVTLPTCSICGKVTTTEALQGGTCLKCLTPTGTPKTCKGCTLKFVASRNDREFHDANCYARYRRRLNREANPPSKGRVFTCTACAKSWHTEALGRFSLCPECKEADDLVGRSKICAYRHCGEPFVDTSPKNGMTYCQPEHRRREKLFRAGLVKDESYFRAATRLPKCLDCKQRWQPASEEGTNIRCHTCREQRRHKVCASCDHTYYDSSEKNTRRYCDACQLKAAPV